MRWKTGVLPIWLGDLELVATGEEHAARPFERAQPLVVACLQARSDGQFGKVRQIQLTKGFLIVFEIAFGLV
jgi:hypothetical protein